MAGSWPRWRVSSTRPTPATLQAWESGRITRGHVRVIVDAGGLVPVERRAAFEADAIRLCEGDTPNRVRAAVEILAERTTERSFTERNREAAACRRVRVIPRADGMSDLVATLPTAKTRPFPLWDSSRVLPHPIPIAPAGVSPTVLTVTQRCPGATPAMIARPETARLDGCVSSSPAAPSTTPDG